MDSTILAHEQPFAIGDLHVRPSTRTLARDGREEVVEPRVMQVLVALARADGQVVSRDDLVERCWDGRIVGDDAVNRIMSRLRRLSEGIGKGVFSVETITKVGYRLRSATDSVPGKNLGTVRPAATTSRRTAIGIGASALVVTGLGISGWESLRAPKALPSTKAIMAEAQSALRQSTREGQNQAIGLYRRAIENQPNYPDSWAGLALAYGFIARYRSAAEARDMLGRARAAAERAQAIDPDHSGAAVAKAIARSWIGHWGDIEPVVRAAVNREPLNETLLTIFSLLLGSVGYSAEALTICDRMATIAPPTPELYFARIRDSWISGQLEITDQLMAEAARLFPTHFAIWFSRFYILLSGGRPDAAIALASDQSQRPTNIPDEEIDAVTRVAQAVLTREPALIDEVVHFWIERAGRGAGYAENAAQFAALLGRPGVSLGIMNAYYFGEGFEVPEIRFTRAQGTYTPTSNRLTEWLGSRMLAPLHATSGFHQVVERLGLSAFWQSRARPPDYLRG